MDKRIIKFTSPYVKGDKGGYYWPEYNEEGQLVWQASEADMPVIAPFDVKGEDGGYYTPNIDEAGELNWVPSNENMPAVEGASLATKEYVDEAVKDVEVDVDLSDYALKTDIPDTSGFITMPEVEAKGYQTEAQVLAIVEENSGGDVFVGAGMPNATAEVDASNQGITGVEITNKDRLLSNLTKGAGNYYIVNKNGNIFGEFYYINPDTGSKITIDSMFHMGGFPNIGMAITGSYDVGNNSVLIIYDSGSAGVEGNVPAPEAGSQNKKWLNSNGSWEKHMPLSGIQIGSEIFNHEENIAHGLYSHAEGYNTETGNYVASHAEGMGTRASGAGAHAEGAPYTRNSLGTTDTSESSGPYANAQGAHAEGCGMIAVSGRGAHAEGYNAYSVTVYANNEGQHLEGFRDNGNYAGNHYGKGAHIEGYNTISPTSNSNGAHVEGGYTSVNMAYAHTQGKYNIRDVDALYADIVGNGTADNDTDRANAYTLDWSGNATFAGTITSATGADYAEYFEWLDGNPEEEDRVGYIVKLNGNKIEFANADDDILGIISGTMTVLGDNAEWYWQGKYLTDDFGRIIYEDKAEKEIVVNPETGEEEEVVIAIFPAPKLNPNYDADMPYENRKVRPEWDAVGMMGKLFVRDDGTAQVNGYVTANNGIATASGTRTNMRVMERVSENIIRVCLK